MKPFTAAILLLLPWLLPGPAAAGAELRVMATIVPIHGLVAAVMEGVGEPTLLVPKSASPHGFALKPSQAISLRDADAVFWSGPGVEAFMRKVADDVRSTTRLIALSEAKGVTRLPSRKGGSFEAHAHEGEGESHASYDAHSWLDPENAIAMASAIAAVLSELAPDRASRFAENRDRAVAAIRSRSEAIAEKLAPLKERKFILFHDATQYFERRFGLRAAGSMTVDPEVPLGARRLSELRRLVEEEGVRCVFAEPQFDRRLIVPIVEGSEARISTIDAEGAAIAPGPRAYLDLLDALAASFAECLSP